MSTNYSLTRNVDGKVSTWQLREGDNRLGRDVRGEVSLLDNSVSREHAVLRIRPAGAEIEDVGSRNGSWLNGARLERATPLHPGDQLQLGDVVLRFRSQTPVEREYSEQLATRLQWDDIQSEIQSRDSQTGGFWMAVMDAAQLMVLPRPASDLFPTMLDLVETVAPGDQILLLLQDDTEGALKLVASRPDAASFQDLPLSKTLVDVVMQNRESVLVVDALNDPQFAAAQSMADLNVNSAMAAPLFDNERVIGLIYAHTQGASRQFDQDQLRAFTMLANLIAIKLTNTRLLEEYRNKLQLEQEMAAAGEIQRRILPRELPEIEGYERLAQLRSCLQMAGDLYDARTLADGTVVFLVGDVSGKGSGAALLMSHTLAAFRVLVGTGISIASLGKRLNEHLLESSDPTHYVTLWIGHLNPVTHRMTYLNAGHNPPLLRDRNGVWTSLLRTSLPVGMLPNGEFSTEELSFEPGSLLCIYTDGLTEARSGEVFFGEDGLQKSLEGRHGKSIDEMMGGVFRDVQAYQQSENFEDDCTLMLLRRIDGSTGSRAE